MAARCAPAARRQVLVRAALPRLHAITDERIARRSDLDAVARALSDGGGSDLAIHARGRALTGLEHYDLSFRLSVLPSQLFVNDRLDIALAGLEQIVAAAEALPVIAIGGIGGADRVREVRASGAYGVAAIRALWDDVEPENAARRMREWML